MRILKTILIALVVSGLTVPLLSCGSGSGEVEASEKQIVAVQRGDLTIDITAAGNLALSHTEDLAFDIFYQEATVEAVLVEEGDTVEEGQVLAKLDTSEWEDNIEVLEDAVISAQRSLAQAQINLVTAEQTLKNTRDTQATKELALLNAQISLNSAQYNLGVAERTIVPDEAQYAQEAVDDAKAALETLIQRVEEAETDEAKDAWLSMVPAAQSNLRSAYSMLYALIGEYESEQIDIKRQQAEAALMSLVQAHEDLNDVAQDIALKELQLTLTQGKLEDAEKAVRDAQEVLEEAKSKSPLIISPFDGFITKVNVEGGDEVMTGTVAVQIADPNKFEAEILVSEMDILQVTLGMPASVEVDAAQGMSFPASVTHISPTATIQQGVVNYQVRVELQSLVPAETAATSSTQGQTEFSAEAFPQRLNQAVNEGHITQEQADEMLKQMQQAQAGQQGQTSTAIPQDFQLREGLTVTVSIIVDERKDVLLVPNAAINSQGGQSYVQVVTTSGETGKRVIQTGITDYQFTEVIEGLTEGEQVVVPQGTTITTISQQQRGGIMIPGMGPR